MSFDLRLGTRDRKPVESAAVSAWAKARGNFVNDFARYDNAATGVYFTMAIDGRELDVNINFNRPSYFGNESFEVLGALCRELGLLASNPQAGTTLEPFDTESLLASYAKGNAAAVGAIAAVGQKPAMMARTDALSLWRYRKVKDRLHAELEAEHGEDYMVPDLVVVTHGGRALRMAFIPEPTYYVMPATDLFMFKRGPLTCIARAEPILRGLEGFFTPIKQYPGLRRSTEDALFERMAEWSKLLAKCEVAFQPHQVARVALDGFADE